MGTGACAIGHDGRYPPSSMADQVRRATAKADGSDFEIGAAVDRPGTHRAKPPGGTDTIADHSQGLEVKIGKEDGVNQPEWICRRSHGFR